jgi:hypothetical protein
MQKILLSVLGLLALSANPLAAHAEMPGQPCQKEQIGTTKMADDKQNIIACLLTGKVAPENVQEWKSMSSGGGGGPTYLGLTPTTYTGNLGGYIGANAKCVAAFGTGARMMTLGDSKKIGRTTNYPGEGWMDCEESMSIDDSYRGSQCGPAYSHVQNTIDCHAYTIGNSSNFGTMIHGYGRIEAIYCSHRIGIHCVKN